MSILSFYLDIIVWFLFVFVFVAFKRFSILQGEHHATFEIARQL
jgi:hypothetical protein